MADANSGSGHSAAEGVYRILSAFRSDGAEPAYLCQLEEGGKKVKRTLGELQHSAPRLLAAFEAAQTTSSNAVQSAAAGSSTSGSVAGPAQSSSVPGRAAVRDPPTTTSGAGKTADRQGRKAAQRRSKKDDSESDDYDRASSPELDDSADETVEPSSEGSDSGSGDDADGDSDEYDDDAASSGRQRRSTKGKKPEKRATRRSGREKAQSSKRYDFGGDEADSPTASEADSAANSTTRASRAARRGRSGSSAGPQDAQGESSDELSIQAQPRASTSKMAIDGEGTAEEDASIAEVDGEEEEAGEHDAPHVQHVRPQDLNRGSCAKCGLEPGDVLLGRIAERRSRKKPGRRRKRDELEEDTDAEEERVEKYGSWVECSVCCVSYHFGCLPAAQKRELVDRLKAEHLVQHRPEGDSELPVLPDLTESRAGSGRSSKATSPVPKGVPIRPKDELALDKTFKLAKCPACKKMGGRRCFVCGLSGKRVTEGEVKMVQVDRARSANSEDGVQPSTAAAAETAEPSADGDTSMSAPVESTGTAATVATGEGVAPVQPSPTKASGNSTVVTADDLTPGLMFRCSNCKRPVHYGCLDHDEPDWSFEEHCTSYQEWAICHDCYNYNVPLDVILAWAEVDPLPADTADDAEPDDEIVEKVVGETRYDERTKKTITMPSVKNAQAPAKYLVKWQNMSYRHLAWVPHAFLAAKYPAKLGNFLTRGSTVTFDAPKDDDPEDAEPDDDKKDKAGEAPLPDANAEARVPRAWRTVDRVLNVWYKHPKKAEEMVEYSSFKKKLPENQDESIPLVAQCYVKWCDLAYKEATVDVPPTEGEDGYEEYVAAYKAFLTASQPQMVVPRLNTAQMDMLDSPRQEKTFRPTKEQPAYLTGGKLMDFQMDGVNFLRSRWWQRKGCILADEMGLGKTCQVLSFLSILNHDDGARPFLVVVPNSLVGNWMREFARWAPTMRVVPYNGDAESRRIVEDYEMFDVNGSLKTHVVLATYEALQGNGGVFRRVPRWDCLVVDEGQRLKGGKASQLYSVINTLRIAHRVILSGTPLNNNLRELFNLLAFINPKDYPDVDAVTARFADLTPELVEEVRVLLKPYFLRRTKDLVLNLPPLLEVVVPVTMTPLQRGVYRGVLERNASAIHAIARKAGNGAGSTRGKPKKSNFTNILMELRKTLCHPYLVNDELEPRTVTPQQAHQNLTEACAKFVLLARMLPKLKAAGHRVLIFSQFKLTLNVLERFLKGLDLKYLRLDGDTPQIERQRDVDRYNAPDSEFFAYLLSTRAGGVGLNITSADVVIIYDQDFNPQMDIQAISRAHRIGQTRPVRVFKLLVKGTCEEKILNAGQKKRGLEHLIIQRIDAVDESEDMESMLQFGATAVFDDDSAEKNAIRYSDKDIDDLLAKTAKPIEKKEDAASTFATAQIWVRDGGELSEFNADQAEEEAQPENLHDFWSKVVDQQEAERAQKAAQAMSMDRGKRRRAQVNYKLDGGSPEKPKAGDVDAFQDFSSGEEYRDKDDADSEYDPQEPMDVDTLGDGSDAGKAPPLARLDDGAQRSRAASDLAAAQAAAMSMQHRRTGRHDPDAERIIRARIDAMKIRDIRLAAETINAETVQKMLYRAQVATTKSDRVQWLRQATRLLLEARHQLSQATPAIGASSASAQSSSASTMARRASADGQPTGSAHRTAAPVTYTPFVPAGVAAADLSRRSVSSSGSGSAVRADARDGATAMGGSRMAAAVEADRVRHGSHVSGTHSERPISSMPARPAAEPMQRVHSGKSGKSSSSDVSERRSGTSSSADRHSHARTVESSSSTKPASGYRQSSLNFARQAPAKTESGSASPVVPQKRLASDAEPPTNGATASSGSSRAGSRTLRDPSQPMNPAEVKRLRTTDAAVLVISDSDATD